MTYRIMTERGHALLEVSSALQKAVRRGDARLAGYWTLELYDSGYAEYVWRRLYIISAEDCWGIITYEIDALYHAWQVLQPSDRKRKDRRTAGRLFAAKAVILLAMARKCRDADHLLCLVVEKAGAVDAEKAEADLDEARKHPEAIPEYAFDCHTAQGKRAGKTREEFFVTEHDALKPRQPGLFDQDVERLRKEQKKE